MPHKRKSSQDPPHSTESSKRKALSPGVHGKNRINFNVAADAPDHRSSSIDRLAEAIKQLTFQNALQRQGSDMAKATSLNKGDCNPWSKRSASTQLLRSSTLSPARIYAKTPGVFTFYGNQVQPCGQDARDVYYWNPTEFSDLNRTVFGQLPYVASGYPPSSNPPPSWHHPFCIPLPSSNSPPSWHHPFSIPLPSSNSPPSWHHPFCVPLPSSTPPLFSNPTPCFIPTPCFNPSPSWHYPFSNSPPSSNPPPSWNCAPSSHQPLPGNSVNLNFTANGNNENNVNSRNVTTHQNIATTSTGSPVLVFAPTTGNQSGNGAQNGRRQ